MGGVKPTLKKKFMRASKIMAFDYVRFFLIFLVNYHISKPIQCERTLDETNS